MRPPLRVHVTSLLLPAALAAAISQAPACSNGDTILALTISSTPADVGGPANLRVTIAPPSRAAVTETFAPELVDGEILMSFFRRIKLNGLSGKVAVTVEALNASGMSYLSAMTTAELVANGAVAARVELKAAPPPDGGMPPDGGGGGEGGGGSGPGGAGGAGGGSSGGAGGGASGGAGGGSSGGAGGGSSGGAGGGSSAENLITNGDFSAGMANWHIENGNGNITDGRYCIMGPSGSMLLGWTAPAKVTLEGTKMYRVSYAASATSGNVRMHLKVAHSVQPYTSAYEVDDMLNNNLRTLTHTFTPMNGTDDNMGIALTVPNGTSATVCIDDVSMVPLQ
jgi:hypothetical protein